MTVEPWRVLATQLSDKLDEARLIYAERTEYDAETALDELIELGEITRVKRVIDRIQEKLR